MFIRLPLPQCFCPRGRKLRPWSEKNSDQNSDHPRLCIYWGKEKLRPWSEFLGRENSDHGLSFGCFWGRGRRGGSHRLFGLYTLRQSCLVAPLLLRSLRCQCAVLWPSLCALLLGRFLQEALINRSVARRDRLGPWARLQLQRCCLEGPRGSTPKWHRQKQKYQMVPTIDTESKAKRNTMISELITFRITKAKAKVKFRVEYLCGYEYERPSVQ